LLNDHIDIRPLSVNADSRLQALKEGLEQKARDFNQTGAEIYAKA
jgi:hypothetical protein